MKALLVNGSPNEQGCVYTALHEVEKTLSKHNIETEILYLGRKPISGCIDCKSCRSTGKCIIKDLVTDVQERIDTIDAIVVGSPVYFGNATSQILAFMDRLFYPIRPKNVMAGKLGAAVVSCRRGGASSTFDQLNKYFTISNMPVVTSQYWNQVHGFTPEDVMKDEEGLQTMRTLGENMAWLLFSIEAGRKNGVKAPQYETPVKTHFIK